MKCKESQPVTLVAQMRKRSVTITGLKPRNHAVMPADSHALLFSIIAKALPLSIEKLSSDTGSALVYAENATKSLRSVVVGSFGKSSGLNANCGPSHSPNIKAKT